MQPVNEATKSLLERLSEVCQDTRERVPGTRYEHTGEMCDALIAAVASILSKGAKASEENRSILSAFARDFAHGFSDQAMMLDESRA